MTRLQTLRANDAQPDIPPAGLGAYLVEHLFDAGPVAHAGHGAVPLGWQDLQAWQQGTGIDLQPWEARIVRTLSHAYLASAVAAKAHDCPAPYTEEPTPDQRTHIANTLRSIFSAFKK